MGKRYFTNGELSDKLGTGLTLMVVNTNDAGEPIGCYRDSSGNPFFGYMAKEITEDEYLVWVGRANAPDLVEYFPSPMGGLLDEKTYDAVVLTRVAQLYLSNIDAESDIVTAKFELRKNEYTSREQEAEAYVSDPTVGGGAYLEPFANYTQKSLDEAAKLVLTQSANARFAAIALADLRMSKYAIQTLPTAKEIIDAARKTIQQIRAIGAQV